MAHKETFNVLLIEDDLMVQEVNKGFIESVEGFRVIEVAGNGEEGLALIKSLQPDLVILDVFMPKKDGIKTLQELRKQKLAVDVIIVSAAKDAETIKLMLQNGAMDYIMKPFKLHRIQRALEKYRQHRRNFDKAETFSQEQLDALLYSTQAVKTADTQLPKGLNEFTLNEITANIQAQDVPRSAEEVASAIGIARVTARRYLDYLEKSGVITLDVQYGGVGRPVNRYVYNKEGKQ
ncbi:response regulator [Planococcus sp. N028]|uniref:Transcriptional regulatory protein n=1 Tax=Planococcus shixiaomingii TaxID=3058393 RepID=A0ABT8N3M2_9BACL|nr:MULTISPECIES: response regulator [unclassified Planococcus (in: firmicutes)]MDN7242475.1 response regulator [Planococcus sp. N028]WKA54715.1 response regulator [Planococcus sp. N022]